MQITFDIPEQLAAGILRAGKDPAHVALEALAVEGYRSASLSEEEVRLMLGLATRMQVHGVLKEHGTPLNYSVEDFERDQQTSRRLRERHLSSTKLVG